MPYSIQFTDSTNPSKPAITVADGSLNQQTSLTFVGQGYSGYASVFAGDLLHLLENFAAASAPANPVQGQLWYDTSTGNNLLRVYDGAGNWPEAGSIKRAGKSSLTSTNGVPDILNSNIGDLWVDTDSSQLYLFSGSTWLLIGPQFSAGQKTGPLVETIVDTNNVSHNVISLYASSTGGASYRIAVVSADAFTPKATLDGYPKGISVGVNMYGIDLNTGVSSSKMIGTADSASKLVYQGTAVDGSNFLRSDIASTTNNPFNVRDPNGIAIGADLLFTLSQGTGTYLISSKNLSNSIDFVVNNNFILHLDPTGKVGLGPGMITPTTALSVAGVVTSGAYISGTGTTGTSYPGGLNITDGTQAGTSVFGVVSTGTQAGITSSLPLTSTNSITANSFQVGSGATAGPVILPPATTGTALYDIGSVSQPFRNIYAQSFVGSFTGNFNGIVTGSVTGTADSLTTPIVFKLEGDVTSSDSGTPFTGQSATGYAILNTSIGSSYITNQTAATSTNAADQFVMYQPGSKTVVSITKSQFLKLDSVLGTSSYGTPVGTVIAWAGDSSITSIPTGWLLCDGSEISTSTYHKLFTVIGYMYGATRLGVNTFTLPDLRGRFILARNSMNNLSEVANYVQAQNSSNSNVNTGAQAGINIYGVTDISASTTGSFSGYQSIVLTVSQLPQHTHTVTDPGHQHIDPYAEGGVPFDQVPGTYGAAGSSATDSDQYRYYTSKEVTGITVGNINSAQTGQAVNIMNPYITMNYIIFTGNI